MNREWNGRQLSVTHLGEYYNENGQTDWLKNQGHSEKDIGTHAGMRDASEVMALQPEGVRLIQRNVLADRIAGSNGNPAKFSAKIGKKMLQLKVDAAVQQIQEVRKKQEASVSDKVANVLSAQ